MTAVVGLGRKEGRSLFFRGGRPPTISPFPAGPNKARLRQGNGGGRGEDSVFLIPRGIPMNSNRLWIAVPTFGLLGLIALACYFWSRGPAYGEIEGRVTRGGLPLELVEVVFYPEEN